MKHQYPNLNVVDHPLIKHKLTQLRNEDTNTEQFRRLVREVGARFDLPETCKYTFRHTLPSTNDPLGPDLRTPLHLREVPGG